ncbi:MAG: hypothetical protein WC455_18835 [Dehalococcoidia bacterium]|jgi:hypothetical protein
MAVAEGQIVNLNPEPRTYQGKTFNNYYISVNGKKIQLVRDYMHLQDCAGKWYRVEYDDAKFNKVLNAGPIAGPDTPSSDEMKVQAAKMTDKDRQIAMLNCNTCTAMLVSQMARFGFFTEKDQIYPEWEKAYRFNLKMVGIEDQP